MFQVPLATSLSAVGKKEFWDSVIIYHNRPHIVNRKIAAADQILFFKVEFNAKNVFDITDILSCHALAYEIQRLKEVNKTNLTKQILHNLLEVYDKAVKLENQSAEDINKIEYGVFLSLRLILPRTKGTSKSVELIVIDKDSNCITFFATCIEKDKLSPVPSFEYRIELTKQNHMRIALNNFEDADTSSAEWLADSLFSKLIKWTDNTQENDCLFSLSQVPLETYCNLYTALKHKYGEPLRKVWWEKTKTDPQKFIFEDIAIATYLICIWNKGQIEDVKDHVKFVDCGCGNGLLVYILNQEGYSGYGIDIRRRNVWELFEKTTDLRVGIVGPESTFPNTTWLIGNHSDELTPWLPVIALRSSPETNYFVLPCCPYDFNGKKYVRLNTAVSQYADYLEYVKSISEMCQFETLVDKLRIPSTKRIALIGLRQDSRNMSVAAENIEKFISSKFSNIKLEFMPRSPNERVRNCTQINREVRDEIIKTVVNILLDMQNKRLLIKADGSKWNKGGSIHLRDLATLLQDHTNILKKECGGIQTLLRNYRYLFQLEDAVVSLREPYKLIETTKYKSKPCWYFRFHPDGCLMNSENCGYNHIVDK